MMPLRLLIVDDDPDDIELFCDAVRALDPLLECMTSKNGVEALEFLNKRTPYYPILFFLI